VTLSKLSGGKQLAQLNRVGPNLGSLLSKVIDSVNHQAAQTGVDPVGQASSPPPPQSTAITVTGEMAHVRITDNNPTNRARSYFTEVYADQQMTQLLHVEHHGASRDATITLPTYSSGTTPNTYYAQSYSQTPGSPPSAPIPFPTPIIMAGATVGVLPQSAGSGTAPASGTVPAQGFGTYATRNATGKIRTV
jgi:hypothetical protein